MNTESLFLFFKQRNRFGNLKVPGHCVMMTQESQTPRGDLSISPPLLFKADPASQLLSTQPHARYHAINVLFGPFPELFYHILKQQPNPPLFFLFAPKFDGFAPFHDHFKPLKACFPGKLAKNRNNQQRAAETPHNQVNNVVLTLNDALKQSK